MGEILGKYRIDGLVAEGGMARILRAKTEGVGGVEKVVALKCLRGVLSEDDSFVRMLMDEARITVRMTHKNIAQVYGLEHDGNTYFMVMEYIDGVSLAELSNSLFNLNRVFPIEAAVFIAMEVCSGLSYAHRMTDDNGEPLGIVHRDVNPQNICISKEGEVKLIDFGIAKARQATSETQAGTIKGKFNYMSPEQARGDRVDQRADVFALGAVLYEMLCGHMLYPLSLEDARLRSATRMADFVPIEHYMPEIPDKLRRILAKALTRDLSQRFATSRDFLLALTQFFHDGCKVYDALNLSILVEKYLAQKSSGSGMKGRPSSSQNHPSVARTIPAVRAVSRPSDFAVDSGDTAIMGAEAARKFIADYVPPDVEDSSATAVYTQPVFDTDASIARSVDLSIVSPGNDSTVMVRMNDVHHEGLFTALSQKFVARLQARLQSVSERALVVTAITLTVILVIAILLFVNMSQTAAQTTAPQDISIQGPVAP